MNKNYEPDAQASAVERSESAFHSGEETPHSRRVRVGLVLVGGLR